jgi:signal transduction histidine kinase
MALDPMPVPSVRLRQPQPTAHARRHRALALLLCAVLGLGIAGAGWWVGGREAAYREAVVEFRTASMARSLLASEAQLARLVAAADSVLLPALWALGGREPGELSREQLDTIRRVALETVPDRLTLGFWNADGSAAPEGRGANVAGFEFFRFQTEALRDAPARAGLADRTRGVLVGAPAADPLSGEASIHVSRAVLGADGRMRGVAAVGIPVATLTGYLAALRDTPADRIAVHRRDGTLLAEHPAERAAGTVDTPVGELFARYPRLAAGRFETAEADGTAVRLTAFAGLDPMPFAVAYTARWRPPPHSALSAYGPGVAIAVVTLAAAAFFACASVRHADALAAANAELVEAKAHLQFEADGRGIFIANMNHELRTPLNAIVGFAQILADTMFGPDHPKYREYARDILHSGRHLLSLIGDIIDFSTLDLGRRPLECAPLDAAAALREVVRLMRPVAAERDVSLRVAESAPCWTQADALALRQILMNLVSNAIKFSSRGGQVDLDTRCDPATGEISLAIADRGIGIAADELATIGKPFFRSRAARKAAIPGTGLGLSISAALAARLGGRLALASVPAMGTTVRLVLPRAAGIGVERARESAA